MGKGDLPAKVSNDQVQDFLRKVAMTPVLKSSEEKGRLIFALDATASREPTWDHASHLQAEMRAGSISDEMWALDTSRILLPQDSRLARPPHALLTPRPLTYGDAPPQSHLNACSTLCSFRSHAEPGLTHCWAVGPANTFIHKFVVHVGVYVIYKFANQ